MREIKFRAWDGDGMQERCTLLVDISDGALLDTETNDYIDWPVMQYTGLKDKNGVEIYEGDIIDSERFYGTVYFNEHYLTYFMKNDRDNGDGVGFGRHQIDLYNMIVCGNIYENKELLEVI